MLALTHPAHGSLIKPCNPARGSLWVGMKWGSPGCPKYVPGAGQAKQADDWHFDQQEPLGECSDTLNST